MRVANIDTEKFRLRRFVEKLDTRGEVKTIDRPIDLIDLASEIGADLDPEFGAAFALRNDSKEYIDDEE